MTIPKNDRTISRIAPITPPTAQTITWAIDKAPIGAKWKNDTTNRIATPHNALIKSFRPFLKTKYNTMQIITARIIIITVLIISVII